MSNVIKYERTEQGTRIVPVYRYESNHYFVDAEKVQPWLAEVDGQQVLTGAMKIGALYDLLGISQTERLLETGVLDMTDAISPNIALETIYVEERHPDGTTKVQRYDLQDLHGKLLPTAAGTAGPNYRQVEINFATTSLVAGNGDVRLDLHIAGHVNLELGHCELVASGVQATPDQGVEYEVLGYTLAAFRINHNRQVRNTPADALAGGHPAMPDTELAAKINSIPADAKPVAWNDLLGEERAFVPKISAFSGLEYSEGWNAKGTQIISHEVEGAASNLSIVVGDEPAQPGNANHRYDIIGFDTVSNASEHEGSFARALSILFQNGPIPSHGNNGVTIEALLAVIAHRLEGFQAGPFASQDNEDALLGVKNALEALQRRTRNRIARQVEGTYQA